MRENSCMILHFIAESAPIAHVGWRISDQSDFATVEKTVLALLPMLVMAVKQTMTMSDNITAYSTAVGPSSDARNERTFVSNSFMASVLS